MMHLDRLVSQSIEPSRYNYRLPGTPYPSGHLIIRSTKLTSRWEVEEKERGCKLFADLPAAREGVDPTWGVWGGQRVGTTMTKGTNREEAVYGGGGGRLK